MKITIEIKTENAAFEDEGELPRILRNAVERLATSSVGSGFPLMDYNGNRVGRVVVVHDNDEIATSRGMSAVELAAAVAAGGAA